MVDALVSVASCVITSAVRALFWHVIFSVVGTQVFMPSGKLFARVPTLVYLYNVLLSQLVACRR